MYRYLFSSMYDILLNSHINKYQLCVQRKPKIHCSKSSFMIAVLNTINTTRDSNPSNYKKYIS